MAASTAAASVAAPAGLVAADAMRIEIVGRFDTPGLVAEHQQASLDDGRPVVLADPDAVVA